MTTADIIKNIVLSYQKKDDDNFFKIVKDYIEKEKLKKNSAVAKELESILYNEKYRPDSQRKFKETMPIPRDTEKGFQLLEIKEYDYIFDDIIIDANTKEHLKQIIDEYKYSDVFATYNLQHKNKILLCGKPGTGKTYSAQIVSSVLNIPLVYIRFDAIISSYLGETANNLKKVFDFISSGMWIVLFDEFDIIGKNRDDIHEHGEIKRVVNNFLQMLDNFNGESIIFAATNHHNLLDPAIWRRFDDVIYYPLPDEKTREILFEKYLKVILREDNIDFSLLAKKSEGLSPSDIKLIAVESIKLTVLNSKNKITSEIINMALDKFLDREKIKELKIGV